ncbi:MAG: PDDEXK nuclease domain-containing protein [Methanocorpusculum sp.]|nr:PDDEXK nuclease domain-containing protein [Methanocorpusculum sp.]
MSEETKIPNHPEIKQNIELINSDILPETFTEDYVYDVGKLVEKSRRYIENRINTTIVYTYWLIGKRIKIQQQKGEDRAEYGQEVLKTLSKALTEKYGRGFSTQSLYNYRQFYDTFNDPEKFSTVWRILTWSHYKLIMRITSEKAREWYCNETVKESWDVRTLNRNISTQYFERLLASQAKEPVIAEMKEKTAAFQDDKLEFIKNPYVLEFLNLPENKGYLEKELEQSIIDSLQKFLLEMGRGFAFVQRQKLIRTETDDFYIDLVFYNYILKCFVLIDLKLGKLTHKDVGQMDMYVRMYDDLIKKSDDNPTLGILLCSDTDKTIAKYSVLNDSKQVFASKYITMLPTEEELTHEIERQMEIFRETHPMQS